MGHRRPGIKDGAFEVDGFDHQQRLGGIGLDRSFLLLLLFLLPGLWSTVLVGVVDSDLQAGVLRVVTGQGERLDPTAEGERSRRAVGHINLGQRLFRCPHISPHPHADSHPRHPGPRRHNGVGSHTDHDLTLARELHQPNDEARIGPQAAGHRPLDPPDLLALDRVMLEHLGTRPGHDRLAQCQSGGLEVVLDLDRRDAQHRAVVLKPIRRDGFGWQVLGKVELHTQQVSQCVVVLVASQSPHHDAATGAAGCPFGALQFSRHPSHQHATLGGGRLLRLLGRHLTEIQLVQHVVPGLGAGSLHEVGIERVQPQFSQLLPGAVTTNTQPLEDWLDVTCKRDWLRLLGHP